MSVKVGFVYSTLVDLVLKSESKQPPKVVVLHDLFLDHMIRFDSSVVRFVRGIARLAAQGGGNLHGNKHTFLRGGNAANIASAFSALGGKAVLIARTSELGQCILSYLARDKPTLDISHVSGDGELASTLSLELHNDAKLVNVMVSDPGSAAQFRFSDLTARDKEALAAADYVCVVDWNQNKYGTELAERVFRYVKNRGRGKTFLATGDPSTQSWKLKALLKRVLRKGLADILSVNENELRWLFREAAGSRTLAGSSTAEESAHMSSHLQELFDARVDVHTSAWSFCAHSDGFAIAPSFIVEQFRATGAGDAWDAASIWADAMNFDLKNRLAFANAAAAFYISSLEGAHASPSDIIRILRHKKVRSIPAIGLPSLRGSKRL